MIDRGILRKITLDVLSQTSGTQWENFKPQVEKILVDKDLFPTQEECDANGINYSYYAGGETEPARRG